MTTTANRLTRAAVAIALALPMLAITIVNGVVDVAADWQTCIYVAKDVPEDGSTVLTFQLVDLKQDLTKGVNPPPSGTVYLDGVKKQDFSGWSDASTSSIVIAGPLKAGKHMFKIHVNSPSKLTNLSGKAMVRGCA